MISFTEHVKYIGPKVDKALTRVQSPWFGRKKNNSGVGNNCIGFFWTENVVKDVGLTSESGVLSAFVQRLVILDVVC